MVTIYDVNSNKLIEKVAEKLKGYSAIQAPDWAQFVKTANHKQRPPVNSDWWYVRVAAVLRRVYMRGPLGVSKLRTKYGGKKDMGVRPERFTRASGNIIRKALQQLEIEKLVRKSPDDKDKGRIITAEGQSLLEKTATSLVEKKPAKSASKETKEKKSETKKETKETKKADKKDTKTKDDDGKESKKSTKKPEAKSEDKKSEKATKTDETHKKKSDDKAKDASDDKAKKDQKESE